MKFKLIKEFTEFNHMRIGSDSAPQSTHVDNPSLSMGAYNRFQMNLHSSLSRLNSIYQNINSTKTGFNLSTGDKIDASDIKNIKIMRIYPKDDIYLNVYFSFKLDEEEYWGVINKINHPNPTVNSEVFKDQKIYSTKEWEIRIKGNIVKAIKKWLNVEPGEYISLKDIDATNENTGELTLIPMDEKVNVVRTMDENILINFNDIDYVLSGRNFFYFNYYFQSLENLDLD